MQKYLVYFDFTTVIGNRFTARHGVVDMGTIDPPQKFDFVEIRQLCINFVLTQKPKWNILFLEVEKVIPKPTMVEAYNCTNF